MAAIESMHSPLNFGIDLGTSNSAIAVEFRGQTEVILVEGQTTLPSVVYFRDDEIIVGRQARARLVADPENTVASVKRELGTVWTRTFFGSNYSPTDISALILNKLADLAERSRPDDLGGTPYNVVICIPANFNDVQKNATLEAARLANLNVIDLLEEPVAAAIAYAMEKERDQTILVYDLGGGTFDVSILAVNSTRFEGEETKLGMKILAKEGVPDLGGDDFDNKIVHLLLNDLASKNDLDLVDESKIEASRSKIRDAMQKLRNAAEQAKMDLTAATTALIDIPDVIVVNGKSYSLTREVTRDEFEETVADLLDRTHEAVERALAAAKLTINDIDRILLVGGSTKMPCVAKMLTEHFGREPYRADDVDTVVARGAAVYAALLGKPVPSVEIENIVTHHLGIDTPHGISWLIPKGTEIPRESPVRISARYMTQRDNMTEMAIRIYQCADTEAPQSVGETTTFIGEFFLTGIPAGSAGKELVDVTFEIDQANLLTVTAVAESTGGTESLQINRRTVGVNGTPKVPVGARK